MATRWTVAAWAVALWLASGTVEAASPATCTVDGLRIARVAVDGQPTTIEVNGNGMFVNGVFCAWQDEINLVRVEGTALDDDVTLRGKFIPGFDYEADWDELEVSILTNGGTDRLTVELSDDPDTIRFLDFGGYGIHLNGDGDADISISPTLEVLTVKTMGGDDWVQANAPPAALTYSVYGGDGNDTLNGSNYSDLLYGEGGDDHIIAYAGDDVLDGGPGNDVLEGGPGLDRFLAGSGIDGGDVYIGGSEIDTADYSARTAALTVTIGNDPGADDGEVGEQDDVRGDVENVVGGKGSDVLIGNGFSNFLSGGGGADRLDGGGGSDSLVGGAGVDTVDYSSRTAAVMVNVPGTPEDGEAGEGDQVDPTVENATGGAGNDTLFGTAGANTLRGGPGNDTLQGDDGNDRLYGDAGDDALVGGAGADKLYGAGGSDVLDGGADADTFSAGGGNDFLYNDDGVAETVNCGPGNADDAEVDTGATDTFVGCEL